MKTLFGFPVAVNPELDKESEGKTFVFGDLPILSPLGPYDVIDENCVITVSQAVRDSLTDEQIRKLVNAPDTVRVVVKETQ